MSNRKESLKKSLGLTEYPWSSDDEDDNTQSNPEPTASISGSNQQASSTTNNLNTSQSPFFLGTRRNPTRLERNLFWSMLSNGMNSAGPSRATAYEPRERVDLNNHATNMQRILAITKLQNLNSNTHSHPERRRIIAPSQLIASVQRDVSGSLRLGRIKRRIRSCIPLTCTRSSIIPAVMDLSSTTGSSARSRAAAAEQDQNSDDEPITRNISPEIEDSDDDNDNAEEEQSVVDEPPENGVALEEEIVEVDGGGGEARDEQNDVQAHADETEGPREEPPAETPTVAAQPTQGVKRKREIDAEPDSVKEFNQSLLRLLECPVCLEWMEPPMSQCRRGHLVCSRCRSRLTACPVCRTSFSSVRNRAMEAVAEMLRYPCRYGCGRSTSLRRRSAHEASCAARRYRCPALPCADRPPVPLADLPHHFQTKHLSMLKVGTRHNFSMKVNTEHHDNWLVMAVRELFHLRVDIDIRTWGVWVYVAYIGPKCNAANFTYEVTVTGQHNDRKIVYARTTHSDLESSTLNVSRQDCFHLTLDQALNFLRFKNRYSEPDRFLDFVVEINKRDVPVEGLPEESDS